MPKATYALVVQTLLLVSQVHQVQPTAGDAIKKKYWTALCEVAADADKIAAKALQSIQQPATPGAASLRNLLRALVYNLANNTEPTSPGERVIWSHFAEEASAAIDFYKGDKPAKLITAVRDAGRAKGAILDWVNTQHKISTSSHGCLSGGDSGQAPTAGSSDMATIHAKCVPNWTPVTATTEQATAIGTNGLTGQLGTQIAEADLANGAFGCNSNSGNTAVKLLRDGTGTSVAAQSPTLVAGMFKLTGTSMAMDDLSSVADKRESHPYVYHIVQALNTASQSLATDDVSTLDKAKNSNSLKSVSRVHLLGTTTTDTSRDAEIPDKIQTAFSSPEKYTAIYSRNVDEMPLTKELTHDPNLKKLGEITDINDLMRLYFFFSDRLKSQVKDLTEQLAEAKR
uniref:Variant surface glycoprotein 1125.1347 n=1 Tax=Trypanosoma brucei TaxID=5691 RepID=A0A1J0R6T4_9TRYP|nr:variant surface glycoprotein 1125.1347 [Trypanosoma brucei]